MFMKHTWLAHAPDGEATKLWCLNVEEFNQLPYGTILCDDAGHVRRKDREKIHYCQESNTYVTLCYDYVCGFGENYFLVGLTPELINQNPEVEKLFTLFMLKQ